MDGNEWKRPKFYAKANKHIFLILYFISDELIFIMKRDILLGYKFQSFKAF